MNWLLILSAVTGDEIRIVGVHAHVYCSNCWIIGYLYCAY